MYQFRDWHTSVNLYKQYLRPHLEFAVNPNQDKLSLEKIQKRALGMVLGLGGETYEEKLEELGLVL